MPSSECQRRATVEETDSSCRADTAACPLVSSALPGIEQLHIPPAEPLRPPLSNLLLKIKRLALSALKPG